VEDKYLKFWDEEHHAFPENALPDMVTLSWIDAKNY